MKTIIYPLVIFALSLNLCGADEEPIDMEARKRSIPIIENQLKAREMQMTEIGNDIIKIHNRLDRKIENIVNRLASIKDSPSSGYRISKVKMNAIGELRKAIESYQSQRVASIAEIRKNSSNIPKDILKGDAKNFDEHVEKHIEQMLKISKSFTQDATVKKYERIGGGSSDYDGNYTSGYGWNNDTFQISDEWRQNRRDRVMDKKQREEVKEALDRSVNRCESLVATMRNKLKSQSLSKIDRELMTSELSRHVGLLETRQRQRDELIIEEKPETSPLTRSAALILEDSLKDQTADMHRDLHTIFFKHNQLNRERSKVFALKANLEARKKWLKENEPKTEE